MKLSAETLLSLVKIKFICTRMKNHFHLNGVALNLALKQRLWDLGNCLSWELNSSLM